jgi:hypothetical protein
MMETQSFTTPDGLALAVKIPAGMIEVLAADTSETTLEIDWDRDPKDILVRFDPVSGRGNRLHVEYRGRRFGWFGGRELHVAVHVPHVTTVEVSTGSADLTVRGRVASITYRTGSGELSFEDVEGDVTAKLASGDLEGGSVGGDLTMHGASGDMRVVRVGGMLTARSASGDVLADVIDGNVQITTVSGDVKLRSLVAGDTKVRAVSGDVEVGVAAGTRVFLDLSATSGDAESDLPIESSGSTDAPDLALHVSTVSGDIRVRRAPARSADGTD